MVFASSLFLFLFLPLTLAGYFLIRRELRNLFLLAMGLLFYAWGEPVYVLLMLGSILLNYATGLLLHAQRQIRSAVFTESRILAGCVIGNLGLLFYFKYANFFINNLNALLVSFDLKPISYSPVFLPIGISFFTFQGIVCYTLQIYFDFSGYSDMAIGLGRLFGFEFLENFNFPYISQSIREFWRRWHISLSTWFRDYLYIPLGGSRGSSFRTYLNLWIIFFLCGLWHGASWNFVVWGALHGVYLVVERLGWQQYLEKLWRPLRHIYTLLLVMIGWVFFRAETLTQAVSYLGSMMGITQADGIKYYALFYCDPKTVLTLLLGCVFATPIAGGVSQRVQEIIKHSRFNAWQPIADSAYLMKHAAFQDG